MKEGRSWRVPTSSVSVLVACGGTFSKGGPRETDGFVQIVAPLALIVQHFYLYRSEGNMIPFYIKYSFYFFNDITKITAIFTKSHF